MLSRNIFVLQPVGFFVCQVDDPFNPRRDKDLPGTAPENICFGTGAQDVIQPLGKCGRVDLEIFQYLGNYTLWLLDQCQQDVLCIDLVMSVPLDDFSGALSGFLSALGKTIKTHHNAYTFLW